MKKEPTAIICLSDNNGGMEIDSIKLAEKLSSKMSIVLISKEKSYISQTKSNKFNIETISFFSSFSLSIIIHARRIIKKYNIKNIIFFGASELKSLYFSFLGLDLNLIIRHGTTKSTPKKDWFHKIIYNNVDYHVSICKHLQKNVREIIPFGKCTKDKLIYSSLKFSELKEKKNNKKINLLHTGRIVRGKGQIEAIKACEILVKNNIDFELFLVGSIDEKFEKEFLDFFEMCNYKDKINLVGFTKDVNEYIDKSDIFIFPSYGEGLSNAFLEAISSNLICLCFNNTSFPELRDLDLYFRLCKNKNIKDLKINLLEVIKDLSEEKQKVLNNNLICRNLFSKNKEINSYLEIII